MEKSFWEKIGFRDKKKDEANVKDAKDKTDKVYRILKDTIQQSRDLQGQVEDCRILIKQQEKKTENLKQSLIEYKQTLLSHDDIIEKALND
jgi:hypothetical protein